MAAGDPYIECAGAGKTLTVDSSEQEVLNALLVKTNTGVNGLRMVRVSAAEANISQYITCSSDLLTPFGVLQVAIGETASGKPAIVFIEEA